jgi:hypothetical protein
MSGRVYNIAKLTSSPSKIFFEGDILISGDSLTVRSKNLESDVFANSRRGRNVNLRVTEEACVRLLQTFDNPQYPYNDFICYSILTVKKIRLSSYREVAHDLKYLDLLLMKPGITNIVTRICHQFDVILTDYPTLIGKTQSKIIDLNKVSLDGIPLPKVRSRDILVEKNIMQEINNQTNAGINHRHKVLVLLYDNQLVAHDISMFDRHKILPCTLLKYPGCI